MAGGLLVLLLDGLLFGCNDGFVNGFAVHDEEDEEDGVDVDDDAT